MCGCVMCVNFIKFDHVGATGLHLFQFEWLYVCCLVACLVVSSFCCIHCSLNPGHLSLSSD